MKDILYIKGDATNPIRDGVAIIVHICNDIGGWGAGFVLAISKRWPQPEKLYRIWHKEKTTGGTPFELGQVQFVGVENDLIVANVIGQEGIKKKGNTHPIRYSAVARGLTKVAEKALQLNASVHMPRIGCGLAGGRWEDIEP